MKSKVLTALVLAGLLSGISQTSFAAIPKAEIFGNYRDMTFSYDDKDFITMRIWENGTTVVYPVSAIGTDDEEDSTEKVTRGLLQAGDSSISGNSLLKDELESFKSGLKYIYDLIGSPKNGKVPVMHLILSDIRDSNAHAGSNSKNTSTNVDFAKYFVAGSNLGNSIDFYAAEMTVKLPKNGRDSCFRNDVLLETGLLSDSHTGTVVHEMVHALGISVYKIGNAERVDHTVDGKTYPYQNYILSAVNLYTRALHGAFGEISFNTDGGKITKIISYQDYIAALPSEADKKKYFHIVDIDAFGGNYFMPVNGDGTVNTSSNVYKVLDIANGTTIAWPDEAKMPAVAGIPINGWEENDKGVYEPELSHIELQNCIMSHQNYRNWGVLMEAEIATLQDIGYSIDRGKFFGGSCYGSDFEEFSALTSSFTSAQDYAIGYHVYGSNNTVKTGAVIKPTGYGAVGIRVDGVKNDVTVNQNITLTGERSTGVMFSYGNGHTLNVTSPVKATGANSIGLRFDFGDNYCGNTEEYRGSYIRGTYTGKKDKEGNNGWYDMDALTVLKGPLMKTVSIDSNITGTAHAIYISRNAFVKDLVLGDNNDVSITGDITSEWNPTSAVFTAKEAGNTDTSATDLKLNEAMLGDTDPATLLTDLQMNRNVTVNGNINGYHSLKMTVADGKTTTVSNQVAVYSILGDTGNLIFAGKDGIIAVKEKLSLTGTIESGNSIIVNFLGEENDRAEHKLGTVKTNSLHVITDDVNATQIREIEDIDSVKNLVVLGTSVVSNQIVASNKAVECGLEEVANVLHDEDALDDRDINVAVSEGNLLGEITGVVCNEKLKTYTEKPNQANTQLSQMNAAAIIGWRAQNNDLNKRMGELRMKNGERGVWARMSRGENKEDATKRQFNLYQVGYDQEIGHKWLAGAALSMTKGNANTYSVTGSAKGEDKSGAFALYASRLNGNGTFVDLIAKYGKTSYDVTSYMVTGMGNYDFSTPSMSVSAEAGRRIKKGSYWVEPQAEFTFGMVKSANYITSKGINAEQERFNSAVGRMGFVFGRDLPEGNLYVRASFLHDFAGNSDLHLIQGKINRSYTNDLGGSWWEFGIGTNLKTGQHSYIYVDVEKTCGGKMQTPWRWNLGAGWSF